MKYSFKDKNILLENQFDDFDRRSSDILKIDSRNIISKNYNYKNIDSNQTTTQIEKVNYTIGSKNENYSYTYDNLGNITSISKNGTLTESYVYDEISQLVRVNSNSTGKTTTYSYDAGGNIREKNEYAFTTGSLGTNISTVNYGYNDSNWSDKLTSYNGKEISYDESGNPLSYDGWTYAWEGGRQLKRMTKNGSTIDYKYDSSGIRTQKTINGVETNYTTIDGKITSEETNGEYIYFRYDEEGNLVSLNYKGNEYFYQTNIQGDIIGIVDINSNVVVEYTYDAWGNVKNTIGSMASTLGKDNPMGYRSYYYDEETALYYMQNRYYNPEFGRFINADVLIDGRNITGTNLFAYCANNAVMNADENGMWWLRLTIKKATLQSLASRGITLIGATLAYTITTYFIILKPVERAMATIISAFLFGVFGDWIRTKITKDFKINIWIPTWRTIYLKI